MASNGKTTYVKKNQGKALWVLGSLFDIKASGSDTDDAMTVIEMTFAPGQPAAPPHRHNCGEAAYVLEGQMRYHVDGKTVDANAGDFLFFPKGTLEWAENATNAPAKALVIYSGSEMAEFFDEVGDSAVTRTLPPPSSTPPNLDRIVAAAKRHGMEVVQ